MYVTENQTFAKHSSKQFTSDPRNGLQIIQNKGELLIDARLLHKRLQVKQRFNDWVKRRVSEYSFIEGEDFYSDLSKNPIGAASEVLSQKNKRERGRPNESYYFTLDTGKEIAMLEKNEIGRQIRRYFIEAEKELRRAQYYGATVGLTEISKQIKPIYINGRKMFYFRHTAQILGLCPNISYNRFVERGWAAQVVFLNDKTYVSEEYVRLMAAKSKLRMVQAQAKAASPVIPENFDQLTINLKGGSHE